MTDPANADYHMNTFVEIKAGETPIDSFTYEINGESVTITGYTGSEGNVTIPSEIEASLSLPSVRGRSLKIKP